MNDKISRIIRECDRRYLLQSERERILQYATSVHGRLALEQEVERAESRILDGTMRHVRASYPHLADEDAMAYENTSRDLLRAMRCVTQAVLIDDVQYLNDKLVTAQRQVLCALGYTPEFVRDVYGKLRDEMANALSEIAFDFAKPYLEAVVDGLSDFAPLQHSRFDG